MKSCGLSRPAGTLGMTDVRLTGGEPLLRRNIVDIIRSLKSVDSVKDLSITTNGSLLAEKLDELKDAGLDRINISLDSMKNILISKKIPPIHTIK